MVCSRRRIAWKLVPLGLVFAVGCQGDKWTSPEGGATLVASVSGAMVPEHEMRASMTAAARLVALSLRSERLREAVLASLQTSRHREHKLHLSEFLRGQGRQILAGMAVAAGSGVTQDSVLARLNGVVDLEFYMPVKSHFAAWGGGSEVVVATALRDHEIPVGFRVDGSAFRFESAEDPPDVPVLALVPVETHFGASPNFQICWEDCGEGGGGGGGSPPPPPPPPPAGVTMTMSYVPGDYEGFLMGDPEFEIHVLGRLSSGESQISDLQCSGEHPLSDWQRGVQSTAYAYDQNNALWTGSVVLISKAQADALQPLDSGFVYLMIEDDVNACEIHDDPQDIVGVLLSPVTLAFNAVWSYLSGATPWALARQIYRGVKDIAGGLQNDDIVGILVDETHAGYSYPDATHVIMDGGTVKGRVNLVPVY